MSLPTTATSAATDAATQPDSGGTSQPVPPIFEIGLVMAGAISAGAYTAGVINFLFEALDNWYNPALQQEAFGWPEAKPIHQVRLKTMGGASAGGMCAALTAVAVLDGNTSRFYDAWVHKIDIRALLDTSDLNRYGNLEELESLLNCTVLQTIADEALTLPASPRWPDWLGKQLDFYLTLTNLNGLTYEVTQTGGATQRFTDHAEHIQFRLRQPASASQPTPNDIAATTSTPIAPNVSLKVLPVSVPTAPLTPNETANWELLKTAALATGAFPIALLNRQLSFTNQHYDHYQPWWQKEPTRPAHVRRHGAPSQDSPYTNGAPYLFVDGGMTDNEPLNLVRRTLIADGKNKPEGKKADRAVLLIDPFPSNMEDGLYAPLGRKMREVIPALYTALQNQARFRTEDLLRALDLDVHNRFVVAPIREGRQGKQPHLAGATVGAFGGFLHQAFREHDYQLGRRNCQRFLRQWFTLPADPAPGGENNALFANWHQHLSTEQIAKWHANRPDGIGGPRLPILPLLGSSAVEVPAPAWSSARMAASVLDGEISRLLRARIDRLLRLLPSQFPKQGAAKWWLRLNYWVAKGRVLDTLHAKAMHEIREELREVDLLQ
ncbi:patatin-like phospholipase family protein [Hymenobacter daecheongensis]|nr:patatin-like phospholipase family protein [Hymenobacter daecheongensis]